MRSRDIREVERQKFKISMNEVERQRARERMVGREQEQQQPSSERICRRCKTAYDPLCNSPDACRFHPSFFVSRRHDDQQRYYELKPGDPPYAAKFYDCCGAEDPNTPGCSVSSHVSYDDP